MMDEPELEFENEAALDTTGVYLRPEPAGFIRLPQKLSDSQCEAAVLSLFNL